MLTLTKNNKYFKTDGIRGKVGYKPITPNFFLKLGFIIGNVLISNDKNYNIILGIDTRISCDMLKSAIESGLIASGFSVLFTGIMPTPGIAYITKKFNAAAGIIISASHNDYNYNGIKLFSKDGTKISNDIQNEIEKKLDKKFEFYYSKKLGKSINFYQAINYYLNFCKDTFPSELNLNGLKILIDCANGATSNIAPYIFKKLGAKVISIACKPNGKNINFNCGSTNINILKKLVILEKADVGLAFDGDGDRIIMIDHLGKKINGDQIIYAIAIDNMNKGKLSGGVVGTIMSNIGLELELKKLNIPFIRTNVGDSYILDKLKEKKWNLGAEHSGHIILLDKTTTCDGIIAGIKVLSIMVRNKMSLFDLCKNLKMFPQILNNVYYSGKLDTILNKEIIKKTIQEAKKELKKGIGRIILRKSGTEPVIRIMVEGENYIHIKNIANKISNMISQYVTQIQKNIYNCSLN